MSTLYIMTSSLVAHMVTFEHLYRNMFKVKILLWNVHCLAAKKRFTNGMMTPESGLLNAIPWCKITEYRR